MTNTTPNSSEPPKAASFTDKLKTASKSALGQMKDAAQYTAKTAQKAKIVNMTLPSAYRALGKHVCREKAYRDDFPDIWKELHDCFAQITALKEQAAARPKAEGMGNKVTAAGMATKEAAQVKTLEHQTSKALGKLGEAVYAKHREQAGPDELTRPIAEALSQVAALDAEIATLSKASAGRLLTPKRIAIGAIAAIVLVVAVLAWPSAKGRSGTNLQSSIQKHASPKDEMHGEWIGTDGSGRTLTMMGDTIVLAGKGYQAETVPYTINEQDMVITFKLDDKDFRVKIGTDHRLYMQQVGVSKTLVFAHEYKGGWHSEGDTEWSRSGTGWDDSKSSGTEGRPAKMARVLAAQLVVGMTESLVKSKIQAATGMTPRSENDLGTDGAPPALQIIYDVNGTDMSVFFMRHGTTGRWALVSLNVNGETYTPRISE